jgi:3-oxoacyl-[acyl-carrier protein] reductase
MTEDLHDRVVVVTGAGRGMGRSYVRAFLAAGAKVVALNRSWDRTRFPEPDDTAYLGEISGRDDVLMATADITDDVQVQRAYEATIDRFGTADVLVNNAGMRQRDLYPPAGRVATLDTADEDFERMFASNVLGTLKVTRRFIQPMIAKRRGSVIGVASTGVFLDAAGGGYTALRPNSREQPYMASKAAVTNLMLYLADEVREHNVAVNVATPGWTRTTGLPAQAAGRPGAGGGGGGPRPLTPEHAVPLVLFLAQQDAQSGVTGKVFDAVVWNLEHGLGDREAWTVRD